MNENKPSLKRSRSTESIEQALKRVKPFQEELAPNNSSRYPSLKPISISTRTTPVNNDQYQQVNHFLLALHKERFGDPEIRESWWKQEEQSQDVEMEETQSIYENTNALLKQAFLTRHQ